MKSPAATPEETEDRNSEVKGALRWSPRWSPRTWLRKHRMSRGYWTFFTAAFFFDAGFVIYFFLFNLYLLDLHYDEKAIGFINGALTLGLTAGTLPAGILGRRAGLRPPLLLCFVAAPLVGILRATYLWEPAQIALAFVAGITMVLWTVSFVPTVAALSTEENRTAAMSLIFSVGVGTSALGGALCGFLPQWLKHAGFPMQPADFKRMILIGSSILAEIGIVAILRLRFPATNEGAHSGELNKTRKNWLAALGLRPFLRRFLLCMGLWSIVMSAFGPFANVYLSRSLHMTLAQIGVIFSVAQTTQVLAGVLLPVLIRRVGMMNGILATQLGTGLLLLLMAGARQQWYAIAFYLVFSAAQWMSTPAFYNLLMDKTPEQERSMATGMTMFVNALVGSLATMVAGILFARYGYAPVLAGIAAFAIAAGAVSRMLLSQSRVAPLPARLTPGASTD